MKKQDKKVSSEEKVVVSPCAESQKAHHFFEFLNRFYQANLAKMTLGISPAALSTAYYSWFTQLAQSPGTLMELALYPALHATESINHSLCIESEASADIRFHKECWQALPWRFYADNFLQVEEWWHLATTHVPGLSHQVERTVSFCARQILDAFSPSNFVLTNPELFYETLRSGGANLVYGTEIGIEDTLEKLSGTPPKGSEHFMPGKDVAITPGKVVFSNHLIELIQYEPQTATVFKEPVLILPAWIMKYYILDLSPDNSLAGWLVKQGHTVFIVSWRNPDKDDRNLGLDDYYRLGAMAAIDTVSSICPNTKINLMGYCLGGTLAMITAAAMARDKDKRLKSLSLLAAQGDFTEAGELLLFATDSEVSFIENMMWDQGYLDNKQMSGSFQMLRSYDLIWSKIIYDYLHGVRRGMIDLLAWNADTTRMPYKMHSEYLEKLFLNNDFAEGRFTVEGKPVAMENIKLPLFVIGTEKDHVAPWKSVYKIHLMTYSPITFVLTSGGHNAGILSVPGQTKHSFYIRERQEDESYIAPDRWLQVARHKEGSWWNSWERWLAQQSAPKRVSPRAINATLPAAPGTYVLQK